MNARALGARRALQPLRCGACRAGVSMAELVRRIVADHVEERRGVGSFAKENILSFVAIGRSGQADTSEHHNEALDEALRAGSVR